MTVTVSGVLMISWFSGQPVFDGGRIIFNNKLLPFDEGINKIVYKYKLDGEDINCHFTLQHVKEEDIELENLNEYVTSRTGRSDNMPQVTLIKAI